MLPLNEMGGLPTKNLSQTRFDGAATISGEHFAEHYLGRRLACSHCPVGCIHIAALREPYEDEAYFYKTSMICYDYEPIYAIGAMLGISDPKGLLKLMDRIEALGVDVMSTGVVLAWATEAFEKGIISSAETGNIQLSWGDCASCIQAVCKIAEQQNEFYKALARGVAHAAKQYGGEDFALSFGGNEMPGYHTGPAAHIGCLIGARHSHLDNGGYSFDQKVVLKKAVTPEETARALLDDEYWRQVLSSLVVCFFARGLYLKETIINALSLTGYNLSPENLGDIGKTIHQEKYRFKFREGFSLDNMLIPERIFETPSPAGNLDKKFLQDTIGCAKQEILKG